MSKRGYQDWLDSLPDDDPDYPHQDDPTEEEPLALSEEWPENPPPSEAELDAMARLFQTNSLNQTQPPQGLTNSES